MENIFFLQQAADYIKRKNDVSAGFIATNHNQENCCDYPEVADQLPNLRLYLLAQKVLKLISSMPATFFNSLFKKSILCG
jgi:hypothetical protein